MEDPIINQINPRETKKELSKYVDTFVSATLDASINSLSFISTAMNVRYNVLRVPRWNVVLDIPKIVEIGIFILLTDGIAFAFKEYLQTRTAIEAEKVRVEIDRGSMIAPERDNKILFIRPIVYLFTFLIYAFLLFLPFITDYYWADVGKTGLYIWFSVTLAILIFGVGAIRYVFSRMSIFKSLFETIFIAAIAIAIPFLLGLMIE